MAPLRASFTTPTVGGPWSETAVQRALNGAPGFGARWALPSDGRGRGAKRGLGSSPPRLRCASQAEGVRLAEESSAKDGERAAWRLGTAAPGEYLAREFGWGVRRMAKVGEEMRSVAHIQAEAFHQPVALFDDFFFQFFEAEVLSALMYRLRDSAPDRYACLVAEPADDASDLLRTPRQELVGVVDVSVQRDGDVLVHLGGAEEYLYVSGIAVPKSHRRRKVASALLKACDALSRLWGCSHLVLHAYEDDWAARGLYSKAGYRATSEEQGWMSVLLGKKRRVLMIKHSCPGEELTEG